MKPDGVLSENMEAETSSDVEPEDYFCHLGLLVIEGRTPEPSLKGRCDGPHCPVAPCDPRPTQHHCDLERSPQCRRVEAMNRQMQTLWKNRIPVCIEVLLLPPCEHGRQASMQAHLGLPLPPDRDSSLLLEQWIIQAHSRRGSVENNGKSPHLLFQAVRSYLHFSQLSAWLNLTHGTEPTNLGYRISPPGEFCTSRFKATPEWHKFPNCKVSKSINIKVSVGTLPRLPYIPSPMCLEDHQEPQVMVEDSRLASDNYPYKPPKMRTETAGQDRTQVYQRSPDEPERYSPETTSPRFNKPRVKSMHELEGESATWECEQCKHARSPEHPALPYLSQLRHSPTPSPYTQIAPAKSLSPPPQQTQEIDTARCKHSPGSASPAEKTAIITRDSGAVPKRGPSLSRKYPQKSQPDFSDQHALSAPEFDSVPATSPQQQQSQPGKSQNKNTYKHLLPQEEEKMASSPKVIITHKNPVHNYYTKDMPVAWAVLGSRDSTDSDNSSPEIDRILNKTLARQLEPLSPQEMDTYLSTLCSKKASHHQYHPQQQQKDFASKGLLLQAKRCEQQQGMQLLLSSPKLHGIKSEHSLCAMMSPSPKSPPMPYNNHKPLNVFSMEQLAQALSQDEQKPRSIQGPVVKQPQSLNNTLDTTCAKGVLSALPSDERISDLHTQGDSSIKAAQNGYTYDTTTTTNNNKKPASNLSRQLAEDEPKIKFTLGDDTEDAEDGVAESCVRPQNIVLYNQQAARCNTSISPVKRNKDTIGSAHSNLCTSKTAKAVNNEHKKAVTNAPVIKSPLKKSVSCPHQTLNHNTGALNRANSLLKSVMKKELGSKDTENTAVKSTIPSAEDRAYFQQGLKNSAKMLFHSSTGLPLQSSPAPIKKKTSNTFDYDTSLTNVRAIKNSISCVDLENQSEDGDGNTEAEKLRRRYSASAPASTNCLLGNFEESLLNGRIEPSGVVDGFTADIGASGSFCPKHINLPVTAFFFNLSDDNAPSPYLGHINLDSLGKRGYHIPKKGTVQITLFNPNKAVVKMFVVVYDLGDMPANCQTFLRQRTLYMPVRGGPSDKPRAPVYLRYLIHLRFSSTKSGKIYLHTDIRLIFARDKLEFDSRVANYELRSFTEGPVNPKFSPKR